MKIRNGYQAIPFNNVSGAATLSTVYTMSNEFYIFRDAALTPDLPEPLSSSPTYIIKRLKTIAEPNIPATFTSMMTFDGLLILCIMLMPLTMVGAQANHSTLFFLLQLCPRV